VRSGRGTRGHAGTTARSVREHDVHLHGWIAAAVQYFSADNVNDGCHARSKPKLLKRPAVAESFEPEALLPGFYRIKAVIVMRERLTETTRCCHCIFGDKVSLKTRSHYGLTMPKPTQLGRPVSVPASPRDAVLDRVPNPHPDSNYVARFTFPEFTAICPVTGQPDFATIVVDYAPGRWLVESKSLKLYLNSFRNHGAFHEDCTVAIGKKLVALLKPKWLRVGGYFHPRGGMPIDVFWQAGKLPAGVWAPDQGVATYRARG
jgi:7-cyano-7-deazaguanine reductase